MSEKFRLSNIKKKKLFVAIALLGLISGVAAVTMSNMLSGNFELISEYPFILSWDSAVPFTAEAFCGPEYTADLRIQNIDTSSHTGTLMVVMTCPNGIEVTDILLRFDGVSYAFVANGANEIRAEVEFNKLYAGGYDVTKTIGFTFNIGAPLGTYAVTIVLNGV